VVPKYSGTKVGLGSGVGLSVGGIDIVGTGVSVGRTGSDFGLHPNNDEQIKKKMTRRSLDLIGTLFQE
jgi:hypothetical protein